METVLGHGSGLLEAVVNMAVPGEDGDGHGNGLMETVMSMAMLDMPKNMATS
jgi:hypothetical protein